MARYRRDTIIVEAIQWTGKNHREMWNFLTGKTQEYMDATGDNFYINHKVVKGGLVLRNPFMPDLKVEIGEWIIKETNGLVYPCNHYAFESNYELEEEAVNEA